MKYKIFLLVRYRYLKVFGRFFMDPDFPDGIRIFGLSGPDAGKKNSIRIRKKIRNQTFEKQKYTN